MDLKYCILVFLLAASGNCIAQNRREARPEQPLNGKQKLEDLVRGYDSSGGYQDALGFAGGILRAWTCVRSYPFMDAAGVSMDERKEHQASEKEFFALRKDDLEAITALLFPDASFSVQDYYEKGIVGCRALVQDLNADILGRISRVVSNETRMNRIRELLTQHYITEMDVDSLIGMHDLNVKFADYVKACVYSNENQIERNSRRFAYHAFLRVLEADGHLTAEEIQAAAGPEFEQVISRFGRGEGEIFLTQSLIVYQDIPLRIVTGGRIAAELNLTVRQLEEINQVRKTFLTKFGTASAEQLLRKHGSENNEAAFIQSMVEWRSRLDDELEKLLSPEQLNRLRQLWWQYNARRSRLNWCRYLAGKEFDWERRLGLKHNEIQLEAGYHWQMHQYRAGRRLLVDLVGEQRTRKLTGRFELTPHGVNGANVEADRRIRKELQKIADARFNTINDRVRRNRHQSVSPQTHD